MQYEVANARYVLRENIIILAVSNVKFEPNETCYVSPH